MSASDCPHVLHYIGADDDHGGIVSVIRALAATGGSICTLGVNPEFVQHRPDPLPVLPLPRIRGEAIDGENIWRARRVARSVQAWLRAGPRRVFHGHSRAGLLVALWLRQFGEQGIVVSVHCYGRRRWFYRWAARKLGGQLHWLSPAMKAYYGCGDATWYQCIPNSLPGPLTAPRGRALAPGRLALGGAGMLVRWKRWELVLEAIALLPTAARRSVSFTHIGAPDGSSDSRQYAAELRTLTSQLGLATQVQWEGWKPSSTGLLASVDAVVIPSRLEPFSMVALEALFAGVPVLAANEGGPTDLVDDGRSGWLYPGDSAEALAIRLRTILESDAVSRVVVDPQRLARFQTPVVAAQWAEVYARLA